MPQNTDLTTSFRTLDASKGVNRQLRQFLNAYMGGHPMLQGMGDINTSFNALMNPPLMAAPGGGIYNPTQMGQQVAPQRLPAMANQYMQNFGTANDFASMMAQQGTLGAQNQFLRAEANLLKKYGMDPYFGMLGGSFGDMLKGFGFGGSQ